MEPELQVQVVEAVAALHAQKAISGDALSQLCVSTLDVSGVGIMLMVNGEHRGMFGSSGPGAAEVEELQFSLGEGPCIDAYHTVQPVLEPDLARPDHHRWPTFAGRAVDAGVRSVFGFPLQVGDQCIGALDLCEATVGPLTSRQLADAVTMSTIVADALLLTQATAGPGQFDDLVGSTIDHRAVVHQASGMVAAQLGISAPDALARIRAHAFAEDRAINAVAQDIVDRILRFD